MTPLDATQAVVPESVIAGLLVSVLVAVLAPVVVFLFFRRRAALSLRNIAVGAAIFVLFALVLEAVLHLYVLRLNAASAAFFQVHRLAFAVYGALAAGVFEETGRYIGLRYAVKPTGDPGTALAYGLGHGGAESIVVGGLGIARALLFAILLNAGKLDPTLAALHLPLAAAAKIHTSLVHVGVALSLAGGAERLVALALQIALSFIVWNAVETRRLWLVVVAITLHMITDLGAGLFQAGIMPSIAAVEGWALVGLSLSAAVARYAARSAGRAA